MCTYTSFNNHRIPSCFVGVCVCVAPWSSVGNAYNKCTTREKWILSSSIQLCVVVVVICVIVDEDVYTHEATHKDCSYWQTVEKAQNTIIILTWDKVREIEEEGREKKTRRSMPMSKQTSQRQIHVTHRQHKYAIMVWLCVECSTIALTNRQWRWCGSVASFARVCGMVLVDGRILYSVFSPSFSIALPVPILVYCEWTVVLSFIHRAQALHAQDYWNIMRNNKYK